MLADAAGLQAAAPTGLWARLLIQQQMILGGLDPQHLLHIRQPGRM